MIIRPCAEGNDLASYGADCSGCMTVKTFETALHARLDVPKRCRNQRNNECACLLGADIGAYDTCGHLCRYCYANTNAALVKENVKNHDPKSPFLIGNSQPGDVIHEAEQKSWLDLQMRLERYEDDEYINNVEHVELCKVYSIAGIDPAVINHIDSPVGTRLIRKSSEEFEEDRNQPAFMEKWK